MRAVRSSLSLIVDLFEGICGYYTACDAIPFQKKPCADGMHQFLRAMDQLNALFCTGLAEGDETRNKMPFHNRPKMHMLEHMVDEQIDLWGTPRNFNCYMDESFIGKIKLICAMSKHPASIERVVMQKCRLLAGVEAVRALL